MDSQQKMIDEVNTKRELMRKRAMDIIGQLDDKHDLRILFIDDYSKIQRTTIVEVFRAFEYSDPKVQMMAFAFLSGISYEDPQFYSQEELKGRYPAAGSDNLKIVIGAEDPKTDRSGLKYPMGPAYFSGGFKYRAPDNPVFGGGENAEKVIGFNKNSEGTKTVLSSQRDAKAMNLLQKSLAEIGNRAAENI
jgi:hypothetical protein